MSDKFLDLVFEERERQLDLWGDQSFPTPTKSVTDEFQFRLAAVRALNDLAVRGDKLRWGLIFEEEVLEVLCETDPTKIQDELVQAAAVAMAWYDDIEQRRLNQSGAV